MYALYKDEELQKKLAQNGNSWVLYISKDFANFMNITENSRQVILVYKDDTLFVQKFYETEVSLNISIKKLIKRGGGYGLILTLPLLNLLKIQPETDYVDMNINFGVLIIRKSK